MTFIEERHTAMSRFCRTLVLALVGLGVATGSASAQRKADAFKEWAPYAAGGLSIPVGNLSKGVGFGIHALGGAEYRFVPEFGIRPEVQFHIFTGKNGGSTGTLIGLGASGVYHIDNTGSFRPYALVNLGLYISSGGGASSNDLGVGLGFGGDFRCGGKTCFAEFRYVSASGSSFVPLTFGVRF